MTEAKIRATMFAAVLLAVEELNDTELAALNIVAQLDSDPRGRLFDYDAVAHLFDQDNGTRMHDETKQALAAVVLRRLRP